jgi:hypothetical protein
MHQQPYFCLVLSSTMVCLPSDGWDSAELATMLVTCCGQMVRWCRREGGNVEDHGSHNGKDSPRSQLCIFLVEATRVRGGNWWECMMNAGYWSLRVVAKRLRRKEDHAPLQRGIDAKGGYHTAALRPLPFLQPCHSSELCEILMGQRICRVSTSPDPPCYIGCDITRLLPRHPCSSSHLCYNGHR